jgi:hypothetical protein
VRVGLGATIVWLGIKLRLAIALGLNIAIKQNFMQMIVLQVGLGLDLLVPHNSATFPLGIRI